MLLVIVMTNTNANCYD